MASFILDSSALGGAQFVPVFADLETGGEFRAVQFQLMDTMDASDFEVHSIGAAFEIGADSTENS